MLYGPLLLLAAAVSFGSWTKLETEPYKGKQDDIYFLDESRGWYVNGARRIYGTRDGGASWSPVTIPGPPVKGLCALQVFRDSFVNSGELDERVCLVAGGRVGGPAWLLRSLDGGASWKSTDMSAHCAMILDVHFFDPDRGIVCAATVADVETSHALILKTADAGAHWKRVYESARPYELTWKASFPTPETGFVTVQSYDPDSTVTRRVVAKTTDAGESWSELPLALDFTCREFGVGFLTPEVGWVGGMKDSYETTNGGASWKVVDAGRAVNKIRLLPTKDGFVGYAIGIEVRKMIGTSR